MYSNKIYTETMAIPATIKTIHNYNKIKLSLMYNPETKFYYATSEGLEELTHEDGYTTSITYYSEEGYEVEPLLKAPTNTKSNRAVALKNFDIIKNNLFLRTLNNIKVV